jgi:hypothetical protein
LIVALAVAVAMLLSALATPAEAQKLIGCDSKLQWPCPGPAL